MVEKLIELTRENLGFDEDAINADTNLRDDLGIDSLDLYELVMAFEQEFNVEIPTDDLTDLNTIQSFADYLASMDIDY